MGHLLQKFPQITRTTTVLRLFARLFIRVYIAAVTSSKVNPQCKERQLHSDLLVQP